jgi:hypothetical protein
MFRYFLRRDSVLFGIERYRFHGVHLHPLKSCTQFFAASRGALSLTLPSIAHEPALESRRSILSTRSLFKSSDIIVTHGETIIQNVAKTGQFKNLDGKFTPIIKAV